jgi:hypothetical protein
MPGLLQSCLCTQAQLQSATFQQWARRMQLWFGGIHRKEWEYCYIAQALYERGMLQPGRRGLGFAVGQEPLAALFASHGCEIVATDMDQEAARQSGWTQTNQHAASLDVLNEKGICAPDAFRRLVSFRVLDMNHIPPDLTGFDFAWSACSLEHLGSIELGKRFISTMLQCLKPHGIAVHTTEFNVSSDTRTVERGGTVLFRRCDVEDIARSLLARGHQIELNFDPGDGAADRHIDMPPYSADMHLKIQLGEYVATSLGLIIEKSQRPLQLRERLRNWCAHFVPRRRAA